MAKKTTVSPDEYEERQIAQGVTITKLRRKPAKFFMDDKWTSYYRAVRGERTAVFALMQKGSALRWKVAWMSGLRSGTFYFSGSEDEAVKKAATTVWSTTVVRSGPVII